MCQAITVSACLGVVFYRLGTETNLCQRVRKRYRLRVPFQLSWLISELRATMPDAMLPEPITFFDLTRLITATTLYRQGLQR